MGLSTILTASVLALRLFSPPSAASPTPQDDAAPASAVSSPAPADSPAPTNPYDSIGETATSGWWMSSIKRQGKPAFNQADYKVFRNVKDYGARGDGSSDDTDAINRAITEGNRCGQKCDSQTTTPAIVYFPPGTYLVSKPIVPYYYTQLIGDAVGMPTIKAKQGFVGIAVIDSDPYDPNGVNWWTNQNNFFRQVRNFRIDLTGLPKNTGTGIHWQVAQATSLQNIVFDMVKDKSEDNKQQGIFMDNGSGGFMTDLVFNGGRYGAFLGNQQFTTRNLTFNDCNTAIYMNWNWVWTFHGLSINNCGVGIDMTQGGAVQTVGSILVLDSTFSNTPVGVATVYNPQQSGTNGTLVLDNVDMTSNVPVAVQLGGQDKRTVLQGNTLVSSWAQGRSYEGANGKAGQGPREPVTKPDALVDQSGRIATKSKPQYNNVPASKFVSVKSKGAKGDGKTDDTNAIRNIFQQARPDDIIYFDHGAYIITDTVQVPKDIKVVGEIWPLIMAAGDKFKDQDNPKPVFQVGQPGDVGNVEMQDLMFETQGPQPGAILMEFNVAGKTQASAGLFDVHFRVGGSAGTQLQMDKCVKNPSVQADPNPQCIGAFMLLHITSSASPYLENVWMWVADHELDIPPYTQVNIYNGRGVLIESTKGAWLWGTSSEHNVLSNYQLHKAQNVFMGLIQSETAYFQPNPDATKPFKSNPKYADPDFSKCTGPKCARTWGLRINDSKDVLLYGGGLYSFFDNYGQVCVGQNNCQDNMIAIDNSQVELFGVSTKASIAMVTLDGQPAAKDSDNRNNFCAAIAAFETS
ncbi:pectate lyase superfamily protein [Hirsutella rhossiliensis]|uniref:Pectate lyase superfamily protein n=1 Tax=Hirsutella rhossiliensis TaxID=111463 RepID=A0A9P8N339_9HYPO|nr:pectate lyase superfamily protein [Hirsutella rhossiliensis]KAH0966000.1 pectate lyase superfamily protein [Hirsutella rhossiliensis]